MFRKILVAYDGSVYSKVALDQGAELARICKAELHVMGIVQTTGIASLAEGAGAIDVWGLERKQIATALETASRDLGVQGLNVATRIREGDAAEEIIFNAIELKADLVVLGHTDKGVFARWFEGSVGARILKDLPCSLLVASE